MKKKYKTIVWGALALFIAVAGYLAYQYFRPPANVADMKADLAENAQAIGTLYLENEQTADQTYLGKTVDISGRLTEVKQGDTGEITLYFGGNDNSATVAVLLNSTAEPLPASGDSVLVRAICSGFLMDVSFNRGVVLEKYR